jgi:hypothetical protein
VARGTSGTEVAAAAGVSCTGATAGETGAGATTAGSTAAGAGALGATGAGRWDCAEGAIRLHCAAETEQVSRQPIAAANPVLNSIEGFLVIALV